MCRLAMIIDDSLTVRKILEVTLRREGLDVLCFPDGMEALRILEMEPQLVPDLLFLDLALPGIDGLTVLRLLRARSRFDAMVIVILSRRDGMLDRLKSRLAGATIYLTKPFKTQEILSITALMRLATPDGTPSTKGVSTMYSAYRSRALPEQEPITERMIATGSVPPAVTTPVYAIEDMDGVPELEYMQHLA